jgi:hypothetical protein
MFRRAGGSSHWKNFFEILEKSRRPSGLTTLRLAETFARVTR